MAIRSDAGDRIPGQPTRPRRAKARSNKNLVPYTGAVRDLDLGTFDLTTTGAGNFGTVIVTGLGTFGTLTVTGLGTFGEIDVDTLNLNGNVISDSTGTISFADENIVTTSQVKGATGHFGGATNYSSFAADGDLIFVGTAGLLYGEISAFDATATVTIAGTGIANKVQYTVFDTNGPSNGTTPDHTSDHITVLTAGHYLCTVSLVIETTGPGGGIRVGNAVFKNDGATLFQNCHGHRRLSGGGADTGSASLSGIIDLDANDTVEVWVWNDTNSDDIIVDDITLTLVQVGGT